MYQVLVVSFSRTVLVPVGTVEGALTCVNLLLFNRYTFFFSDEFLQFSRMKIMVVEIYFDFVSPGC